MSQLGLSPLEKLRNYLLEDHRSFVDNKVGEILTIIDASISDAEQRKAIKDLIRQRMYANMHWEDAIRSYLLMFANKHCPDLAPTSKEEEDRFMGRSIDSPSNLF